MEGVALDDWLFRDPAGTVLLYPKPFQPANIVALLLNRSPNSCACAQRTINIVGQQEPQLLELLDLDAIPAHAWYGERAGNITIAESPNSVPKVHGKLIVLVGSDDIASLSALAAQQPNIRLLRVDFLTSSIDSPTWQKAAKLKFSTAQGLYVA
jgi:hypothetical protein